MLKVGLPDEARAARASRRAVSALALAATVAPAGCGGVVHASGAGGDAAGARPRVFVADDASYLAETPTLARELAGVRYLTFYVPNERGAGDEAWFVGTFRQRYREMPDGRDAFSYEAATVLGAAVRAVGADRRKVRDWMARVGNGNPALPGVTGEIRFNTNRTAQGKHVWIGEVES